MSASNLHVGVIAICALVVISTLVIFAELIVRAIFPIMMSIVDSTWIAFLVSISVILTRIAWLITGIAVTVVLIVVPHSIFLPLLLIDIALNIEVVRYFLAEMDDVIFVSQLFYISVNVF